MGPEAGRVEAIFGEVVGKSAAERAGYLDEACAGRLDLRKRVDRLLAAHDSAGDFLNLERFSGRGDGGLLMREGPGSTMGPYKIVRPLGEGGFGAVFLAEQAFPVRRQVALKIIKLGMDTRQVIARFEAERQALAMMEHPNIARVLDAGSTEQGRPYFVMELAIGVPITRYCDGKKLAIGARLELLGMVCHAVQHAHQKGIIHRDIKPSNILVTEIDGVATPKVIDFGIVKATQGRLTDVTVMTEARQTIGTPAYMSPEQGRIGGVDVDTRSDIYSLGVVLYELLTGTTPFSSEELQADSGAMERLIGQTDAVRPSVRITELAREKQERVAEERGCDGRRLEKIIRGELDWIVMKCLEKERGRRYETAVELAADLERYRQDEPVVASPPSTTYRMKKFMRRHRIALQIGAAFVLLLVAGAVISAWQAARATAAAARATAAQKETAKAEQEAVADLSDMFTTEGLEESSTAINGRSVLWFANAAAIRGVDAGRIKASMIRFHNYLRGEWEPVAALRDKGADHCDFSPTDSRYLITWAWGRPEGGAKIWDLVTEREVTLPMEIGELRTATWAPDGSAIVGSRSGVVAIVDVSRGEVKMRWDAGESISWAAASDSFVAAAAGKRLLVWSRRATGSPAAVNVHPAAIEYLAFNAAGDRLVTAAQDHQSRLFAPALGDGDSAVLGDPLLQATHYSHERMDTLVPVFVDSRSELVLIGSLGDQVTKGRVDWYSAVDGMPLGQTVDDNIWTSRGMYVSPDGSAVIRAAGDGAMYDTAARKRLLKIGDVSGAAFSTTPSLFFIGDPSRIKAMKFPLGQTPGGVFPELRPPSGGNVLSVSSDGKLLAALQEGGVQVWKIPAVGSDRPQPLLMPMGGDATWSAFSPDGKYVAPIGGIDGHQNIRWVQVFAAATGAPAGPRMQLDGNLESAAFSPDGRYFAMATGVGDPARHLRVCDWKTGELAWPMMDLSGDAEWLAYAPDGKSMALKGVDGELLLIGAADGRVELKMQCAATRAANAGEVPYPFFVGRTGTVMFSHDGGRIYTCGSPVVEAWDRATGKVLYRVKHGANCWAMAESPDGRLLATGGDDGMLRLTDAATGRAIGAPIPHGREVINVAFSARGDVLCTCSQDNEMRIFDVATRQLLHAVPSVGKLSDAVFSADGSVILESSQAAFQLWDTESGNALTPAYVSNGFHMRGEISADGHWLVATGSATGAVPLALPEYDFRDLSMADSRSAEDAQRWAELLSCGRIEGTTFVRISNEEWLERWEKYREGHDVDQGVFAGAGQK